MKRQGKERKTLEKEESYQEIASDQKASLWGQIKFTCFIHSIHSLIHISIIHSTFIGLYLEKYNMNKIKRPTTDQGNCMKAFNNC